MTPAREHRAMSLPERLSREVARVAVARERMAAAPHLLAATRRRDMPSVSINVGPALALMESCLERAHAAAGSGDASDMIASLHALQAVDD